MPVTTLLSYAYDIPVTAQPTTEQSDRWSANLKNSTDKLLTNLQAIVPNTTAYGQNMVTPAVARWATFINPAYTSIKGEPAAALTAKMGAKMIGAADKYMNSVNKVFGNGGAQFKADVEAKKDNWGNIQGAMTNYVLPVIGTRQSGIQAIPFTINALTGRGKAMRMVGNTVLIGTLVDIVTPGLEPQFRVALNSLLIQLFIQYYLHLQTPAAINGQIVALINGYVNPAICNPFAYPAVAGSSALYYSYGGANKQLVCQVVTGTP